VTLSLAAWVLADWKLNQNPPLRSPQERGLVKYLIYPEVKIYVRRVLNTAIE
jgi:hypothetical protein